MAIGIWMARQLGPAQLGELNYVLAFFSATQAVAVLGLDITVINKIATNPSNTSEIIGTTFVIRLVAALIGGVGMPLMIFLLRPEDSHAYVMSCILSACLIFQTFDVIDLYNQSYNLNKTSIKARSLAFTISNCIKILLLLTGSDIYYFVFAILAEFATTAILLACLSSSVISLSNWKFSKTLATSLFCHGFPILISGLIVVVTYKTNLVILRETNGDSSAGQLAAILPLAESWFFLPAIICTATTPTLSRVRTTSLAIHRIATVNILSILWWTSLVISVGISTFAPLIASVLYGEKYPQSGQALRVYIFILIPVFLNIGQSIWLVNEGEGSKLLPLSLIGAIVSVSLGFIFIPQYGPTGGATAIVLGLYAQCFLGLRFVSRQLHNLQTKALFSFPSFRLLNEFK